MSDYDLIVIGGGSGGVRAARIAAGHGAKVAICEEYRYGGTCVIRGCVPKKMFVYASHFYEDFQDSAAYGWDININGFDWKTLLNNKDQEIDRLNGIYANLLNNAGVEVFNGRGTLVDANTVNINNPEDGNSQTLSSKKILVATGATPFFPDIPGIEHAISSNEAFYLPELPKSVIVVGGGYIAVEFAGIFNGLGSKTDLVYRSEQILRGFDADIRQHLHDEMQKKGVNIKLETNIAKIENVDEQQKKVTYEDGSTTITDCVMYATGRTPNTNDLGLITAGVKVGSKGEIPVNKRSQTNVENIYAVGDVTDRIALTPVATMEGHAFADSEFGKAFKDKPRIADHSMVPSAVFSQPPIATVGLTEEQASQEFKKIDTYRSEFRILKHTLTENSERTLMKLIVDSKTDRVLGAHMIGADAAEIIQGIAIAIKAGAKKADFDSTVGIHPTSAEEFCTMRTKVPN